MTTKPIERDRFFILNNNDEFYEFSSIDYAQNCSDKQFVIIDKFSSFSRQINDWRKSMYVFIDKGNNEFKYTVNSWTLEDILTTNKSSNKIEFDIIVKDPLKRIRSISFVEKSTRNAAHRLKDNDLSIVTSSINHIKKLSKLHNWEQVDLESDNKKLNRKITELEKRIADFTKTSCNN